MKQPHPVLLQPPAPRPLRPLTGPTALKQTLLGHPQDDKPVSSAPHGADRVEAALVRMLIGYP